MRATVGLVVVAAVLMLTGCGRASVDQPIATAEATASAAAVTVGDDPLPAPNPWGLIPLEVRVYLSEVRPYTTPEHIVYAPQMSAEDLNSIVETLETLEPPGELEPAHETLLKGYRAIAEGRRIRAENLADNVLQAEARSLADFGQVLLREHVQIVSAYVSSLQPTPVP